MAKRKTAAAPADAPLETTLAAPTSGETPSPGEGSPAPADGNGERRRPLVSYRLSSDRTTSLELAVWGNTYTNQQGEEYEQLTVTLQRSYRTDQGWHKGGAWRVHDLPCLLFLLQKAHAFALDRRTEDSTIPF